MSDLADDDFLMETIPKLSYEELLLILTHKQEQQIAELIGTQETLINQIGQLYKDVIVYLAKPAVKGAAFTKQSQELKNQQTDFIKSLQTNTDIQETIEKLQQELLLQRKGRVLNKYQEEIIKQQPNPATKPVITAAKYFDPTKDLKQDEDETLITPQAAQLLDRLSVKVNAG